MTAIAVIGAGNGGLAAVADLWHRGHEVTLWNRGAGALEEIRTGGGVAYDAPFGSGFASLTTVTTRIEEAIDEAEVILVCLPAVAHAHVAGVIGPKLRSDQIIVLNPGGLLGSVAFARDLRTAGHGDWLNIGETGTLSYICRKTGPASIRITSVAVDLPFAALPGHETQELIRRLDDVLPSLKGEANILAAGISSINTVLHPPAMVLAAAWIEQTGGDFRYYADTAVTSVARLMEAIDRERLLIARAWGVNAEPFLEVFARIGSTSTAAAAAGDFGQALIDSEPNRDIRAPRSLDTRYLHEDIPFGIVPLADLGRAAGVATPVLDAIITITSTIAARDYHAEGRTLAGVGLGNLSQGDVVRMLEQQRP